jgi:hypothetical protein
MFFIPAIIAVGAAIGGYTVGANGGVEATIEKTEKHVIVQKTKCYAKAMMHTDVNTILAEKTACDNKTFSIMPKYERIDECVFNEVVKLGDQEMTSEDAKRIWNVCEKE